MSNELKNRTFKFALNVAILIREMPITLLNQAYCSQLIKCSSSVGANYRAACRAKSDNDFINKLKIVEEEADESNFFLELLHELYPGLSGRIENLHKEGEEILRIMVASIITARKRISSKRS